MDSIVTAAACGLPVTGGFTMPAAMPATGPELVWHGIATEPRVPQSALAVAPSAAVPSAAGPEAVGGTAFATIPATGRPTVDRTRVSAPDRSP